MAEVDSGSRETFNRVFEGSFVHMKLRGCNVRIYEILSCKEVKLFEECTESGFFKIGKLTGKSRSGMYLNLRNGNYEQGESQSFEIAKRLLIFFICLSHTL